MSTVELSEATGSLSEYVRKARRETLVLTRRGKAVAAMTPLDEEDYFSMRLANDPEFIAIIERGRAQYKAEGGGRIWMARARRSLAGPWPLLVSIQISVPVPAPGLAAGEALLCTLTRAAAPSQFANRGRVRMSAS